MTAEELVCRIVAAMNCKTCAFWKPAGPYTDGGGKLWVSDLGECLQNRFEGKYFRRPEEPAATPTDAVSISKDHPLRTGPDFGCVNHSPTGQLT